MKLFFSLLWLPLILAVNMCYAMELATPPHRDRAQLIVPCVSQHEKRILLAPLKSILKKITDPEIRFNFEKIITPIQQKEILTLRELAYLSCYVGSFDSLVGITLYESEKVENEISDALSVFWKHFHVILGKQLNLHEETAQEHALFELEHNEKKYLHYLDEKQRENERFMQFWIAQKTHFDGIN